MQPSRVGCRFFNGQPIPRGGLIAECGGQTMKFVANLAMLFALGLLVIYIGIPFNRSANSDLRTVSDPHGDFSRIAGIPLPTSAMQIVASDDHGGFHGDGTFELTARISRDESQRLLSQSVPWTSEWVEYYQLHKKAQGHISRNPNARYAARERCCQSLEWHNGDILAVDPIDGTLHLISWDY